VHGAGVVQALLDHADWRAGPYRTFFNVNFPPVSAARVRGTRVVQQGFREDTHFSVEPQHSPAGRRFLWIKGGPQHMPTAPGTDAEANLAGYISVTPMRADLTAHDLIGDLRARLEAELPG
jgi:5'-nucleotidase